MTLVQPQHERVFAGLQEVGRILASTTEVVRPLDRNLSHGDRDTLLMLKTEADRLSQVIGFKL